MYSDEVSSRVTPQKVLFLVWAIPEGKKGQHRMIKTDMLERSLF